LKTIYLLRHGQAGTFMKSYDQLSDLGKRQAEESGSNLKKKLSRKAILVHGSLQRQEETASFLCRGLDLELERRVDSGFNEFSADVWRGVSEALSVKNSSFSSLLDRYKKQVEHNRESLRTGVYFRKVNGFINNAWVNDSVELPSNLKFTEFSEKVISSFKSQVSKCRRSDIVIVSSVTPIFILYCFVTGQSYSSQINIMSVISNLSLSVFKFSQDRFIINQFNSTELILDNPKTLI
jgi:broad specificity phosphatase PhoE